MANDSGEPRRFTGFRSPNYTQVPDELFDELLPDLSGAELKVLLYIVRRTFGFKRESDSISLSQITSGIETRDGEVLDRGTGLSKASVATAVKTLEARGIIVRVRRRSDQKGDEPTTYSLNVLPVSKNQTPPGLKTGHPPVQELDTQETDIQKTEFDSSKLRMALPIVDNTGLTTGESRPEAARRSAGVSAIGDVLAASRLNKSIAGRQQPAEDEGKNAALLVAVGGVTAEGDSARQRVPRRRERPRRPVYDEDREVLLAFVQDFAREFNDRAPLGASVTRAHNLLRRSGLPRDRFLDRLYQARAITKERSASIRSQAGKDGVGLPTKNKMAYFFAVLEDLLAPADDRGRSAHST